MDRKDPGSTEESLDKGAIRKQLDHVLASTAFDASERNRKFLGYVVEEALAGRAAQIKAYCIAVSVFKRDPSFDPQSDPIVRLEAGRLRRSLERYYLTDGRDAPIRIDIPKGSYAPRFERTGEGAAPATAPPWGRLPSPGGAVTGGLALVTLACVALLAWAMSSGSRADGPPEPETLALGPPPSFAAQAGQSGGVVVMPFRHLSAPSAQPAFAAVLTEHLVHDLALRSGLELRMAEPDTMVPASGFRLDGSVQAEGGKVRVLARLSDAATGTILWSEQIDRTVARDTPNATAQAVSGAIAAQIAQPRGVLFQAVARRLEARPPQELTPGECAFLATIGRYERSARRHAAIRACLQRLPADLDDAAVDDAAVWAALSLTYADEHQPGKTGSLDRALEAALRAVELNSNSLPPRIALYTAYCLRQQPEPCMAAGKQALAIAPEDPWLLADVGLWHMEAGDLECGLGFLNQALERDPSQAARLLPVYGMAQARLKGGSTPAGSLPAGITGSVEAEVARTIAFVQLGRLEEAHAAARKILATAPDIADRAAQRYRSSPLPPSVYAMVRDSMRRAGLPMPE